MIAFSALTKIRTSAEIRKIPALVLTFFNIGEEVSNLRPHVGRGYSHSIVAGGLEEMS